MQEKDHQRFGQAFGERYCLLQKVRRAEMQAELTRFTATPSCGGPSHSSRSAGTSGTSSFDTLTVQQAGSSGAFGMPPMAPFGGFMMPCGAGALPAAAGMPLGMMPGVMPGMMPGMMLGMMPGMMPFALPPHVHHPAGMRFLPGMPPPGGAQGAHGAASAGGTGPAARYMVQDLTTGQKVYLDTSFQVFPCAGPLPGPAGLPANRSGSGLNNLFPQPPSNVDAGGREGTPPGAVAAAAAVAAIAAVVATTVPERGAKGGDQVDTEGGGSDADGSNGCGNSGSGGGSNVDRDAGAGSDDGNGNGKGSGNGSGDGSGGGGGGRDCSAALRCAGGADASNNAHQRGGNANGGVTSELRDGLASHKRPFLATDLAPGGPAVHKPKLEDVAAVAGGAPTAG